MDRTRDDQFVAKRIAAWITCSNNNLRDTKAERGPKSDCDFRISDLVDKTLMELIFNPYGEFRWNMEVLVSQIHSPHLHAGATGVLRYFKICSDAKESVGCGKQREAIAPIYP